MAIHIPLQLGAWFFASKLVVLVYMERHFGERSCIAEMNRDEALAYIDERVAEWEGADGAKRVFARPILKRLRALRAEVADVEGGVHPREILNTRLDRMYREVRGGARTAGLVASVLGATFARFFGDIGHDMGDALDAVLNRIERKGERERQ